MGSIWELDFYSRPILDENQKKVWEVLICESPSDVRANPESLFRFAKYCPSTQVNSGWLRTAIDEAIEKATVSPTRIRFFRRQMNNMITKACKDAGIPVQPSRRILILHKWLEQRIEEVYPKEPGYQAISNPSVRLDAPVPQRLPDALESEKWGFVTLKASDFTEMNEWDIGFGEGFPLSMMGIEEEAKIPGILLFSGRAIPLAAWMSGLELANLKFDPSLNNGRMILETGASESWVLANIRNSEMQTEAKAFEQAKQKANGVHFIGVQSSPESESFAGFWLLQEVVLA
ncbi:MAG: Tab2/Atab2 family RNA-binding protein [Calothrix sp. C42_A2020_038]|nr:Tab2/Atab2 family RNA-binding protein [Calothrix sp. C42_A2020_038]